jgi:hypothetical protein
VRPVEGLPGAAIVTRAGWVEPAGLEDLLKQLLAAAQET